MLDGVFFAYHSVSFEDIFMMTTLFYVNTQNFELCLFVSGAFYVIFFCFSSTR